MALQGQKLMFYRLSGFATNAPKEQIPCQGPHEYGHSALFNYLLTVWLHTGSGIYSGLGEASLLCKGHRSNVRPRFTLQQQWQKQGLNDPEDIHQVEQRHKTRKPTRKRLRAR